MGFFSPPDGPRFALRRLRAPACLVPADLGTGEELVLVDVLFENGRIGAVEAAGTLPPELGPDLDESIVLPGLIDCHAHLDKGHIWPRAPNPTGEFPSAIGATALDRSTRWTADDVRRRMEFGLATACAHGVVAIRTHLDSQGPQAAVSWPVFCRLRDEWSGRIALQATSNVPIDVFLTDEGRELADVVAESGGQLGCVTRFRALPNVPLPPEFDVAMTNLFALARERQLDVDLHVDETGDPGARSLIRVAQLARAHGFPGDILCGHCSSLAMQDAASIAATLDACATAGIDAVSLPTVNLYLQDRADNVTPRWRGVTVLHEMKARGMRVAVGGDNCRDPFYAYGDHDMLDTFTAAVKILHLDHPLGDWIATATATPAAIMGLAGNGRLEAGAAADLLVLRARTYSEMLARHQADRVVLRNGRAIDTTLPDYRRLDDLMV
ncbi:MAG TPA: cytosine deaminase [Candidatus Lustribacter sp.]|jgi:cytosine deaminase|nr:cytosine deaminase [Candidatus Lustribacter sp.]